MADAATYSACWLLEVVCQVKGPFALVIVSKKIHGLSPTQCRVVVGEGNEARIAAPYGRMAPRTKEGDED